MDDITKRLKAMQNTPTLLTFEEQRQLLAVAMALNDERVAQADRAAGVDDALDRIREAKQRQWDALRAIAE